jgi:hypothetical protein
MKTRKELPRFGYLSDKRVSIDRIVNHLTTQNLLDCEKYNDIKVSANSKHREFVIANEFNKNNFFKEESAPSLEGEFYKQLYLTDFDTSKASNKVTLEKTTIFKRTKRLDPNKIEYLPEADELNYGVRNELVTGIFEEILNMFTSKITRVRLAYLKGGFEIKPHIDYDPSYIIRYHIPIITHESVSMSVERKGDIATIHLPADGRIFFFNSGLKHWVINNSNLDRLHLIIDMHGQAELKNLTTIIF